MIQSSKKTILLLFLTVLIFNSVKAQNIWLNDTSDYFAFEFVKASMKQDFGTDFFTGAYNLSFAKYINENAQLKIELPITRFSADFFGSNISETAIGNMYLGYKLKKENALEMEFGALLPTAKEENTAALLFGGLNSDLNRLEFYYPDIKFAFAAKFGTRKAINENGLYYKLNGGLLFLREDSANEDFVFINYVAQIGYTTVDNVNLLAGLSGRTGLNENTELDNDGDKSSIYFGAALSYRKNKFEPGLSLRLPMDNPVKETVSNSIAISLLFHLN